MTKEQYFEMCEMLGTSPLASEIPIEFDDFSLEVQETFNVYHKLRDVWDYMGGNYIGKDFSSIIEILTKLYSIVPEDIVWYYDMLLYIDKIRREDIQSKKPKHQETEKPA